MDRCFKCGSTLQIQQQDLDADPPRMAAWEKPFRDLIRTLRRIRILPGETGGIRESRWLSIILKGEIATIFLSIIPGLAHLLLKSFNTIVWYVAAWFVCLLATLFFYGSLAGYIFLGLCLVLHAWIAIHAKLIKTVTKPQHKLMALIIVGFLLLIAYYSIGDFVFQDIDRVHSSVTIPYHEIRVNDYLLANRIDQDDHFLPRGSIVIADVVRFLAGGEEMHDNRSFRAVGQIIAFENETLSIKENTFYVDDIPLEKDKYPVPMWLRGRALSVTIPEDAYFVASEYDVNRRNALFNRSVRPNIYGVYFNDNVIKNVCVLETESVQSKVFMLWSSLTRRKFIRDYE